MLNPLENISDTLKQRGKPIQSDFKQIYRNADRMMEYFLWGYFLFGLGLAPFYGSWMLAVGLGGACLAIYYACRHYFPGTLFTRCVLSLILWNFSVQFIMQMHGMYEMHFTYFIGLTVLIIYQDWRVMIPLTLYAVVHHLVFFILQSKGVNTMDYWIAIESVSIKVFVIHMFLAAAHSVLCGAWAQFLKLQTEKIAKDSDYMSEQINNILINKAFAESISRGEYTSVYSRENPDELGLALLNMRDSLISAEQKEKNDKFINVGLAGSSDILRTNTDNISNMANEILQYLIKYLGANQGYFYALETGSNSKQTLKLSACYAYNRKKYLENEIMPGEGLVGQCFYEAETIYMLAVPEDYVRIQSATGEASPRNILLVPLKLEDKVMGVIEIASFQIYEQYIVSFLERIAQNIASTMSNVANNERTKKLLESTQLQTEMLRAQEEEMRQNTEEMQATQEETSRRAKEYEAKIYAYEKEIERLEQALEIKGGK